MYTNLLPEEPILMPWQAYPVNGDNFICEKFLELKEKFNINTAIELGSCVGGTTKWLAEEFDNVYTVEINAAFREFCLKRIEGYANVDSILGDTVEELPAILEWCDDNTIIFIDSHWEKHCPLLDEISIIHNSQLKPVIAIHDWKVPGHPELGFDSYNGQDFEWEWIKPSIEAIYGVDGYEIEYNSKAMGAKRGILYIMPKV